MAEPPTAPAVAAQQQGGPASQYISNFQPSGEQAVGTPPMALVEQKLNQVASDLRDIAKVLMMSKPALMPVLQKMIQAGSMLMQEVAKQKQGQQQAGGPPQSPGQPGGGEDAQAGQSPTMGEQ